MKQSQKNKKDSLKSLSTKKLFILTILIMILCAIICIHFYIDTRDISLLKNKLPQPTLIYDRHGEIASKMTGSKIEGVGFDELPDHLILAIVAIEDHRFYDHPGIDYIGILRALVKNVKAGEIVEGGSTITQQLTKNVFLSHEQTLSRKWDEFFIAQKIERTYSKNEIMEMYVNHIYFGEGAWGIRNAAEVYFGKEVTELTVSESAILAGLIKAPSKLSPLKNYEKSIERRNLVLHQMKIHHFISQADFEAAVSEEIVLQGRQVDPYEGKYSYYVDQIIEEAIERYGLTQNEILSGGFHIYTELDQQMQSSLEEVYGNDELFPKSPSEQLVQSGAILIEPESGGIRALIGGRGEHVFRGFNHATQLERQPGSTIKPLAVYTPALEEGYSIFDSLEDKAFNFNGYRPKNYNGSFKGSVSMINAVTSSDNVPAVWLLNKIGIEKGIDALNRFGIPLTKEDRNLSIALGGIEQGVSPLQMAEAYTVFPNKGIKSDAHSITKMIDSKGNVVAVWQSKELTVTSSEVAERMTYMLRNVVENGTGKSARLDGRELAGKTGSTQVPIQGINGTKDHWFVGYTPELVGSIWLGFDKTDETHYLTTSSSQTVTVIFKEIMERALKDTPKSSFHLPTYKEPKKEKQSSGDFKEDNKKKGKGKDKKKKKKRDDD
ncbi:PBP1A family penicillin-binding protein [Bacillus timonensis]|nr:PBP1A family penicillin-binding protein [Bacillus timonensis]